jgi:ADP-ribose pyrophosphatase
MKISEHRELNIMQIIDQNKLFTGRLISVIENVVIFEGSKIPLEAFQVPTVSLVIPRLDDHYVFVEQYRHAINRNCIEFPAGKVNLGEDTIDAARRELLEETGFFSENPQLVGTIFSSPEYGHEKIYVYQVLNFIKMEPNPEKYEKLSLLKLSENKVNKMILSGDIFDAKTIAAYLLIKLNQSQICGFSE